METVLCIPGGKWDDLHDTLFPAGGHEGFGVGLARPCLSSDGVRFVLEAVLRAAGDSYQHQSYAGLAISREESSRLNMISAKAARFGLVPVHLHSHPAEISDFSAHDTHAESELHAWLQGKGQPYLLSLVAPRHGKSRTRLWHNGAPQPCGTRIGLRVLSHSHDGQFLEALDRQRAFGQEFAHSASSLHVGIVGVGGVGMPVVEMLARSGFSRFTLMDPDRVETSNLNRLQGFRAKDVGRFKVDAARNIINRASRSIGKTATVHGHKVDINLADTRQRNALGKCDLILALTDDELSRIACLKLALEHGAEYLQAGVRIDQSAGAERITGIKIEVTGAEIGRYCPICSGRLNPGQASVDARRYVGGEVWERAKSEGYIPEEPSPSIMSLNALAAGALVLEIQKRIAGLGVTDLWQQDFLNGTSLREQRIEQKLDNHHCAVCSIGVPERA